jgi:predicted kinase
MGKNYARKINSNMLVEDFVDNVLEINESEKREAIRIILEAEKNIQGDKDFPTLTSIENRDFSYRYEKPREKLRKQICDELFTIPRLDDENKIHLGKSGGGSAPRTPAKKERTAYYIIGLPASGKSGIAASIADECGAFILDSDYAKRKLPEYAEQLGAPSNIHDESDVLIFHYKGISLFEKCFNSGYNIVIPKIGSDSEKVNEFCGALKNNGYTIYLILADLDRQKATRRAYERFKKTRRYVPLAMIFDIYANEPTVNYYRIKNSKSETYSGFAHLSTDVDFGQKPILIGNEGIDIIDKLYKVI